MPKNFLIGNFLPGRGSAFGRISSKPAPELRHTREELERLFGTRRKRARERRSTYTTSIQLGIVLALIATIGAFQLDFRSGGSLGISLSDQEVVQMEEIVQTQQIERPPPPPRPPVPVEVPNDVDLDEATLDFDALLDLDEAIAELPPPPAVAAPEPETEPEIFVAVEDPPEMIGGMASLHGELKYPELARRAGIGGTVVVQVVIDATGQPSSPTVVRSVSEVLDNEAVRAVMKQRFVPGKQRGRAVSVYMAIPVVFRLT